MLVALRDAVTLPFRLVAWSFDWAGRLIGVGFGFGLMVVGTALWAGPLFPLGIPLFVIGVLLTMRCLG